MGDEIESCEFSEQDFANFQQHLAQETSLLSTLFSSHELHCCGKKAGFELEACLVDEHYKPACINERFLKQLNNPLASVELAQFNIELNSQSRNISGTVFRAMYAELQQNWNQCRDIASQLDAKLLMIGILPTLDNDMLNLANISHMQRYRALNREVFRKRKGKPLVYDIRGVEHCRLTHRDVMLEAASTSFQIHLMMEPRQSVRLYNSAMILSAPMVALSANSPFLFGKNLWSETRIPLFEQTVEIDGLDDVAHDPIRRVNFGSHYVQHSLYELFENNLKHYPILLPVNFPDSAADETELELNENLDLAYKFRYLRLHNGTIWRWNRPLLGIEAQQQPHLRLEHRVMPAGPSVIDTIANMAFFYGTLNSLATQEIAPETDLQINIASENFYRAAQFGLDATIRWFDGKQYNICDLLLEQLLPIAKTGLDKLGIVASDTNEYLTIIQHRLESAMNGSQWQRSFVNKHQASMTELTKAYYERQESGEPVHLWTI